MNDGRLARGNRASRTTTLRAHQEPPMARSHTITCAHDDCPEWSTTASLKPGSREQLAAEHRADLADEGWTDLEGRDYCPDHTPSLETR